MPSMILNQLPTTTDLTYSPEGEPKNEQSRAKVLSCGKIN
jgi:hypothetical protein